MVRRRDILLLGAGCLAGTGLTQVKYPERPIRLVAPFAPGGVAHAVNRQWTHAVQKLPGPVIIKTKVVPVARSVPPQSRAPNPTATPFRLAAAVHRS